MEVLAGWTKDYMSKDIEFPFSFQELFLQARTLAEASSLIPWRGFFFPFVYSIITKYVIRQKSSLTWELLIVFHFIWKTEGSDLNDTFWFNGSVPITLPSHIQLCEYCDVFSHWQISSCTWIEQMEGKEWLQTEPPEKY